jgi:hypothetical protein
LAHLSTPSPSIHLSTPSSPSIHLSTPSSPSIHLSTPSSPSIHLSTKHLNFRETFPYACCVFCVVQAILGQVSGVYLCCHVSSEHQTRLQDSIRVSKIRRLLRIRVRHVNYTYILIPLLWVCPKTVKFHTVARVLSVTCADVTMIPPMYLIKLLSLISVHEILHRVRNPRRSVRHIVSWRTVWKTRSDLNTGNGNSSQQRVSWET